MSEYFGEQYGDDDTPYQEAEVSIVQYAPGYQFVNVYEMDREYGGPEEGGWYFDTGRLVASVQVPESFVESTIKRLEETYPNTGKRYSVIYSGSGDYSIMVENEPGKDFPEVTPHYE